MLKNLSLACTAILLCPFYFFGQGTLSGKVFDQNKKPLPNAHVFLEDALIGTYTGQQGKFNLGRLDEGDYNLKVTYLGYETYSQPVEVLDGDQSLEIILNPLPYLTEEVVVSATRLSPKAPATFQNIEKKELEKLNLGQDLPFLINWTPSLVATSDAGAGVGYTGIRIRGSDQTRINVTVNGIPINDAESQGVFWVNMPDLASSLSSVQIQRGLGSSTNGSGAFGASINLETNNLQQEAGGAIDNSYGSFNTRKHTVEFNSGRLENGFAIEGRLSAISSDGYIDRATSDLKSYYLSAGYYGKKTVVKGITFVGAERTYQAWWGTPESRLEGDVEGMLQHAANEGYTEAQTLNLLNSGRTFNYYLYENEVDDYQQDHYQLHLIHEFNPDLKLSLAGHYTYGRGFFEQYRNDDSFLNYGKDLPMVNGDTIFESDFIRRRWLDNDFYGGTYALDYRKNGHRFILGGGLHFYRGDHFGEIVWAEYSQNIDHLERYYEGVGNKDDYSVYGKWEFVTGPWNFMADLQYRRVDYETFGIDNDLVPIDVSRQFNFFNPKAGVRFDIDARNAVYLYLGRGNREPVRNDFIDAAPGEEPLAETLNNIELGYTFNSEDLSLDVNGYLMDYENQLVLTGELNDVGAAIRRNVSNSYRMGIEIDGTVKLAKNLMVNANLTLSRNKIGRFNEILYDYSEGFDIVENTYEETDISFSPEIISAGRVIWKPFKEMEVNLIAKHVGEQFLDNTGNEDRKIPAYTTTDLRLAYSIKNLWFKEIQFSLLVNNIFDVEYSSNGYTYSYIYGDLITENFFYPQAGVNFLAGLRLTF